MSLNELKLTASQLCFAKRGITSGNLYAELACQYPGASSDDILRAIHEAVQENNLVRIEYQLADLSTIFAFYLPEGSRIL